jgi:hypothetical protein
MFSCLKKKESKSSEKVEKLKKKERKELFNYLNKEQCDIIKTLNTTIDKMKTCITIQEKTLKELQEKKKNPLECSICMNNTINKVLVPCGHTFCENCIALATHCYTCRAYITGSVKMFIN